MSVTSGHAKLTRASKDLLAGWSQTKTAWRDEKRRQFEKKYLPVLRSEIRNAERAMERIHVVLARVRHDCS